MEVAGGFGPRVTSFRRVGGGNVFADLGDLSIPLPDGRQYRLVGGHRLWVAPEVPEVTYAPDDGPVAATKTDTGMEFTQTPDLTTRIGKTVSISVDAGTVELIHCVTNEGETIRTLAPWAITQLPVGGTALVPLARDHADPHGLQPNAEIVLWPYAGIADTPFAVHDRCLLIPSGRATPTKVGTSLDRGWLAYVRDGLVFVKWAEQQIGGQYLDRGAAAQCYSSPDFVELETLGPAVSLEPGQSTTHTELWRLYPIAAGVPPEEVPDLLNLDEGGHP